MEKTLHILHLEDNENDAVLVRRALVRSGFAVNVERVSTAEEYEQALQGGKYDLIMSDNRVPGFDGMRAFKLAQDRQPQTPFMFVTGTLTEERMLAGIEVCMPEFVSKGRLDDLARRVRAMLEQPSQSKEARLVVREQLFDFLLEVCKRLARVRDLAGLFELTCHAARQLMGADGASFVLREGDLCHYIDEDTNAPLLKGRKFPMKQGIAGWVIMRREAVMIEDIHRDPRIDVEVYEPAHVQSLAMVPVRREDPLGAIGVYWERRQQHAHEEISLLRVLAEQAGVAIENLRLYSQLERITAGREQALAAMTDELRSLAQAMAHYLRAPLRAIDGFAQMLREEAAAEGDTQNHAARIQSAAAQMSELIDHLSRLAHIVYAEMREEPLDLGVIARRVIAELRAREPEREVEVTIPEGVPVRGDPGLLNVMLEHLLTNAWKFTAKAARARIEFGVRHDAAEGTVYFVRDNGVGFDVRHTQKLFLPFERLHTDDEQRGAGIGLATVKRVVQKHGGRVWVEAAPERGATFFFTLPGRALAR